MNALIFLALASTAGAPDTRPDAPDFYVSHRGDTVRLPRNADFVLHAHPQKLSFGRGRGRQTIPADSIAYLYIARPGLWWHGQKAAAPGYSTGAIATREGGSCTHFVRELYREGPAAILLSPYCDDCTYLRLYYRVDGAPAHRIRKSNFGEIVAQHFSRCPALTAFARNKSYTAPRLYKLLDRMDIRCAR